MGVSCVHSDRMDRGLLLELDVPSNVLLGNQFGGMARGRRGLIDYKKLSCMADNIFGHYQVSPANKSLALQRFSGGNQQKIIIGREFLRHPRLAVYRASYKRGRYWCMRNHTSEHSGFKKVRHSNYIDNS